MVAPLIQPHETKAPARHGDSLAAKPDLSIADIIVDPLTRKLVANALRFMSMQTQIRNDRRARQFYYDAARLFD